jgi:hypothetical protein
MQANRVYPGLAVTRANMLLLAAFAARSDGGDTYEL